MPKVDLHIHSHFSGDGELPPLEIVRRCQSLGMELIAITDHNSVRGVPQAMAAAKGIRVIPGVELDCTYGGKNFHLLGYGIDNTCKDFMTVEQDIIKQEKEAAEKKIRLFTEATGIPLEIQDVLDAAAGGVVTGELIAQILLSREDAQRHSELRPYLPGGMKSDMPNVRFYWDFFAQGRPAYVPIQVLSLPDAVSLVHSTGGLAVLAHPGQNIAGDDTLLRDIISERIDGLEVFCSYYSAEESRHFMGIAREYGLLATCGSDFHGKHKPNIPLGGHGAPQEGRCVLAELEKRLLEKA